MEGRSSTGRCSPPVTPWAASTSCISRASRPQERSSGLDGNRTVVSSRPVRADRRRLGQVWGHFLPQSSRGMKQEEVHVSVSRYRLQDAEVARRQAGKAEDRDSAREVQQVGRRLDEGRGRHETLSRAREPEPVTQVPPKLCLPGDVSWP